MMSHCQRLVWTTLVFSWVLPLVLGLGHCFSLHYQASPVKQKLITKRFTMKWPVIQHTNEQEFGTQGHVLVTAVDFPSWKKTLTACQTFSCVNLSTLVSVTGPLLWNSYYLPVDSFGKKERRKVDRVFANHYLSQPPVSRNFQHSLSLLSSLGFQGTYCWFTKEAPL